MDISLLQHGVRYFKSFSQSVSSLQKRGGISKANPEIIKISRGVALLFIALILAWFSKTETENSAREKVLHSEWPPVQIWTGILKQGGWSRLEHSDLSVLLKNHPAPFSQETILWETTDHCYLYLTHSPFRGSNAASSEPELWACAQRDIPISKLKWRTLGSGYESLNRLAQVVIPVSKKSGTYIDPKEIRY